MSKDYERFRARVLRERATTGNSAATIAAKLGSTKGTVIGILWRYGKRRVDAVAPAFRCEVSTAFSSPAPKLRMAAPKKPVNASSPAPKRSFMWPVGPHHTDADEQKEIRKRIQAHEDKIAKGEARARELGKKPPTEAELREMVAEFERTRGVTACPVGGVDSLSNTGLDAPVNSSRLSLPKMAIG